MPGAPSHRSLRAFTFRNDDLQAGPLDQTCVDGGQESLSGMPASGSIGRPERFDAVGEICACAIAPRHGPADERSEGVQVTHLFAERAQGALVPAGAPVTSLLLVSGPRDGVTRGPQRGTGR